MGWLCIGIGGFVTAVSVLGICAARSGSTCLRFVHFVTLLLVVVLLEAACVAAVMQALALRTRHGVHGAA